jgi:hypothetical protein
MADDTRQPQDHAHDLMAAMHDNSAFDAKMSELRADRSVSPEHMKTIAKSVLGYVPGERTKKGLLERIGQRQMMEARGAARSAALDKGSKWGE